MRNLARGRVIGRIIARRSIGFKRNIRNTPAAVLLNRIIPARSRRTMPHSENGITSPRKALLLFMRETPVRSENRPAVRRVSIIL